MNGCLHKRYDALNLAYGFSSKSNDEKYNSNSYVAGLLLSIGVDLPGILNPIIMPGVQKPVPRQHF